MAASVFDSPLYTQLFPTGDIGRLFTDSAEIRALLLVEGALARAQGSLGVIPKQSAEAIHRASLEIMIDPGALATATGQNGVSVPGLVAAFRAEMNAPEHAQYIHWGATSQDIIDTAQMLRLRQMLALMQPALRDTLKSLGHLAQSHASTPMAARTWGQHATPTSFGATAAMWGAPLLGLYQELDALRPATLWVSLAGAAGTSAALGPQAAQTRAALATARGLLDPARSWHSDRSALLMLAAWLTRLASALGKIGEDLTLLAQSGINEISLGSAGSSSTMPQKQNPVAPAVLSALARQVISHNATLQGAALHRQERDGTAWFTEWLTLPQLCLASASALLTAQTLTPQITPNTETMQSALESGLGLIHAEALCFALADHMPRPQAQTEAKKLCQLVATSGRSLATLAAETYPNFALDTVFIPAKQMGSAPSDALAFAKSVAAL